MDKSLDGFFDFLKYLKQKGLIKFDTARTWETASRSVLQRLDEGTKRDLSVLDLELEFSKFVNLEGKKFSPGSLSTYKSRVQTALAEFFRYVKNPSGYRPQVTTRTTRNQKQISDNPEKVNDEGKKATKKKNVLRSKVQEKAAPITSPNPASGLYIPIPIREGVIVDVRNLPYDLTMREAEKIAAVIKAMASNTK